MIFSDTPAYFSVRDIHAYYGESYIVQGVSFEINEGEILALLGRNGAGKTSTLRSIARIGDPLVSQGEIWLDGDPLHKWPVMKPHAWVWVLFQKTAGLSKALRWRKTLNWLRLPHLLVGL